MHRSNQALYPPVLVRSRRDRLFLARILLLGLVFGIRKVHGTCGTRGCPGDGYIIWAKGLKRAPGSSVEYDGRCLLNCRRSLGKYRRAYQELQLSTRIEYPDRFDHLKEIVLSSTSESATGLEHKETWWFTFNRV